MSDEAITGAAGVGGRVLVTTGWLRPGDEVHRYLEGAGLEVVHHAPSTPSASGTPCGSSPSGQHQRGLGELLGSFDAVVAGTERFRAEHFRAAAPRLKVIGRTGAGYDNIDLPAATEHGVAVCPTPGVNRQSVAEHTMGLLLSLARRIPQNTAAVRAGGWEQSSGRELSGATLGIVGLGAIGSLVAELARAFGMQLIAHDPAVDPRRAAELGIPLLPLPELLGRADFVSLHVFLGPETRHLLDAKAFALMKPGAFLVNAARGGVVDESALAEALNSGRIAGAALDTVETEPLPADSPLRGIDSLLVTAHIGAATAESRSRSGMAAARSVVTVLQGGRSEYQVNRAFAAHPRAER